jgi:Flp pilus assembly protein TadG
MISLTTFAKVLRRDARGTMAIETALVAPILALMGLGTYDVANIVSKQQDLQSGASEATQIVLAAAGGNGINSNDLKAIIASSLNVDANHVTIDEKFRCDADANLVDTATGCDASKPIYKYVKLTITDSYTPLWTNFGVGDPIDYSVVRTVQTA